MDYPKRVIARYLVRDAEAREAFGRVYRDEMTYAEYEAKYTVSWVHAPLLRWAARH